MPCCSASLSTQQGDQEGVAQVAANLLGAWALLHLSVAVWAGVPLAGGQGNSGRKDLVTKGVRSSVLQTD